VAELVGELVAVGDAPAGPVGCHRPERYRLPGRVATTSRRRSAERLERRLELAGQFPGGVPLVGRGDELDVVAPGPALEVDVADVDPAAAMVASYSNTTAPVWPA
jgi:hypothetical protein